MSAGSPISLSVAVQPTNDGVSLKLAQFVRIQKCSPLKTQSLKVHEPRSIPHMTGVDFIINELIKVNIRMKYITFFLILILIDICACEQHTIHLYTHSWCPPCRRAKSIFDKLQKAFPDINFQFHRYYNKTVINTKQNSQDQGLPFPTIMFSCNSLNLMYQNELTYQQIDYWVQIVCLKRIPDCTMKINEQLYKILVQKGDILDQQSLRQILKHPHLKICASQSSNLTLRKSIEVMQQSDKKTLYFDYFDNNIRNYLIQSKKLAIAIISSSKNTSRVNSFFESYLSLKNYMGETANQTTRLLKYQLTQQHKQNLVFLQLCINSNVSKCIFDPDRKVQVSVNKKMAIKLLEFCELATDELGELDYILAVRFNEPLFQYHIYHHFGLLDEKFLFWINEILSIDKANNNGKQIERCFWNSVTFRMSQNNLEDIQTYLKLKGYIDSRHETNGSKFNLNRIVKKYHSQPKMSVCILGRVPSDFYTNLDLHLVLEMIGQFDLAPQNYPNQL